MRYSLADLRARRGALLERARTERTELIHLAESQRTLLGVADAGLAAVRFLLERKGLVVVAVLAFAIAQPRRAVRWALRAFSLYRVVRKVRRFLLS